MTVEPNTWMPSQHKRHFSEFLSGMELFSKHLNSKASLQASTKTPSILHHLRLFQLFGSTPLSLEQSNFSRISKTAMSLTLVFIFLNTAHLMDPDIEWRDLGKYTKYVSVICSTIFVVSPILLTYMALRKRFSLEITLNNIIQAQRRLGASEYRLFGSTKILAIVFLLYMSSFIVFRIAIIIFTEQKALFWVWDDAMWIAFYLFMFFNALEVAYLLKCVGVCYSRLSTTYLSGNRRKESIDGFAKMYSHLGGIVAELNNLYDIRLTLYLLSTFAVTLDITTEIFADSDHVWWDLVGFYAWIPAPIIGTYYLFDTCHKLTNQAEECNLAMVNSIIFHKSETMHYNPLVLVHLCGKQPVMFKICDTFIVDYSFGISMLAAFFTYIVILYQMEKGSSPKSTKSVLLAKSPS